MKGKIDNSTIVDGFNTPFTIMNKTTKQKINKETEDLNNTINQADLTDINRILNLTTTEYISFSSTYRTISKTDHKLGHKTIFNKFKRTEII